MNARFVRERVAAHNGLVALHRHARQASQQTAGGIQFLAADVSIDGQRIAPHVEDHGDFFQRRVAGAFADAVDGALHLARAAANAGQRIGHGHTQVVVRVRAEHNVVHARHARLHVAEQLLVFGFETIADGVRQVQHRRARFHCGVAALNEIVAIGAARILRREFHVLAFGLGVRHGPTDHLQNLFTRLVQLVLKMNVRRRQKGVDARPLGSGQSFPGAVNVQFIGAGECGNDRPAHFRGNGLDCFEVALRSDGEPGLEDVHAQPVELARHLELLRKVHAATGRLLAVA